MKNTFDKKLEQFRDSASQVSAELAAEKDNILSFVSPVEIVELPSGGKFYEPDHPLYNKNTVEIKQMTAKEEDILTNKSFIKKGIVIDRLIESLLIDKTIPVESLLVGDKNAIMVATRIAAYGANYDITVNCRECASKNLINVDLLNVKVKDVDKIIADGFENLNLKVEKLLNGNIIINLPKTKWTVECKLMDGKDERKILSMLEKKRKADINAELTISEQLKIIICSLNGHSNSELIDKAVDLMPAGDAKLLRNTYQRVIPDVKIENKFSCRSCGFEQEMEVPFTQEFFWPK